MTYRFTFKSFKPFNRCAPFKPPPVSSPRPRGRSTLKRFERFERLELFRSSCLRRITRGDFDSVAQPVEIVGSNDVAGL